ncbi:hypothetical protein N9S39_00650 [Candidatus Pelagibacter sp.]|nr:hypothetical protein [Candidatus Pelagibacter sp.]
MKNKSIIFFFILTCFIYLNDHIKAEEFVFESDSIEIKNEGNIISADNGVQITTKNKIKIIADRSVYNKINSKLTLYGNVIFYDIEKEIKILSKEVIYKKDLEKVTSSGKTLVYLPNNLTLTTNNLEYLQKNIIQSKYKAILVDEFKNQIIANNFKYSINDKLFQGVNVQMFDEEKNNYFFEKAMVDLGQNMILAKDIEINFSKNTFNNSENDPRLRGKTFSSNEDITIIKNGVFTSCKKNDTCPPWTLQSKEIKHDKNKKTIYYKDAWLKLYDKPVFYFPKFFHPDPTVKRQSGFLTPSILNSTANGGSLSVPYYKVLSENKDFTVTPRIFFNNDVLVQSEFRQVEKNYENIIDLSLKQMEKTTKSHFFANTKIDLNFINFDYSDLEFNIEKTSNDTYLKTDQIKTEKNYNSSVLNSFLNYNMSRDDLDVALNFALYEDLTTEKKSDKYEYIYPNFTISKLLETNFDSYGSIYYNSSGSQKKYNTNISETTFINDLNFISKPFFSRFGFKNDFKLLFKNTNKDSKNSNVYKDKLSSDNYASLIFNSSYPLKKKTQLYESQLKPRLSFRANPRRSENLRDQDRRIDGVNVFSTNRLGVNNSLEGGQSLTIGSEYNLSKIDGKEILNFNIAQIYRDINDENLPTKSKMRTKSSDVVGGIKITPNNYFDFSYDFSLDNNLDTSNYSMAKSSISVNNFITTFEFLEENNEIGSESYFSNETSLSLDQNNKLKFRQRTNRKTNLKEFYNLIYQYENDCLIAAVEYNKNYYSDGALKPLEELFFSLTIVPFTNVNSPNVRN